MPIESYASEGHGPATEKYLYRAAADIIVDVASGASTHTPTPLGGAYIDGMTPHNVELHKKVSKVAEGFSREDANELVKNFLRAGQISLDLKKGGPEIGPLFPELYDIKAKQPNESYSNMCYLFEKKLRKSGLDIR